MAIERTGGAGDLPRVGGRAPAKWGWYFGLGLILVVLGAIAMSSSTVATFLALRFFGWALVVAGLFEVVPLLTHRELPDSALMITAGVLYIVVGTAAVAFPSAAALRVLIAVFLMVQGALRVVVSIVHRQRGWGWTVLHGAVALAFGAMVWLRWPTSGTWMLGLLVGIDVVLTGITAAALGLAARNDDRAQGAAVESA